MKPYWLNKKIDLASLNSLKTLLRRFNLKTVCEECKCPNISECFKKNIATFMILGDTCTRNCSFCAIKKGKPHFYDKNEPLMIKRGVEILGLSYVVITSPTRDDLEDKGCSIFVETAKVLKENFKDIKIELLIPDFLGKDNLIEKIAQLDVEVITHNLETVPLLYPKIKKDSDYFRSLKVLKKIKEINNKIKTKSSILLGFGENLDEVLRVFEDLRSADCDFLTLGQYLQPSLNHYPTKEYIHPEKFSYLEKEAKKLGFKGILSSPYVRSSYLASSLI